MKWPISLKAMLIRAKGAPWVRITIRPRPAASNAATSIPAASAISGLLLPNTSHRAVP